MKKTSTSLKVMYSQVGLFVESMNLVLHHMTREFSAKNLQDR